MSIAYAVRHPERVSHLVLLSGFALGGNKRSPQEKEKRAAMTTLMRMGWGANDPGFRQLFTSQMMPGATKEQSEWFNELQRRTTSPECAARYFETVGDFDVTGLLAKVTKCRRLSCTFAAISCIRSRPAARSPPEFPARALSLCRAKTMPLLPGQPAAVRFFEELQIFLTK